MLHLLLTQTHRSQWAGADQLWGYPGQLGQQCGAGLQAGERCQSGDEAVPRPAGEEDTPRHAELQRLLGTGTRLDQTSQRHYHVCGVSQCSCVVMLQY